MNKVQNSVDTIQQPMVYYHLSSRDVVTMFDDNFVRLHKIYINFTKKRKKY